MNRAQEYQFHQQLLPGWLLSTQHGGRFLSSTASSFDLITQIRTGPIVSSFLASSFRGLYSIRALPGRFSSTLYVFRCPVWLSSFPCTQTGSRPVCFASLAAGLGDKIFLSFPVASAWLLSFIIQTCSRLVCLVVSQQPSWATDSIGEVLPTQLLSFSVHQACSRLVCWQSLSI